jgi:two-component system, OmpR family, sensor histidine kinase MprB
MSFRRRITLLAAAAVAVAVLLASALTYLLVAHQLRGQLDAQLRDRAHGVRFIASRLQEVPTGPQLFPGATGRNPFGGLSPRPNQVRGYQQLVNSTGTVLLRSGSAQVTLPVSTRTRALAAHGGRSFFSDARVDGIHLRILAESVRPGVAVQFAEQLTEVDHLLSRLRLILLLLALGGIALAALLGRLVAGAVVLPVGRLTRAAEHVARTQDLSGRIEDEGRADEIGRLALSFNAMLDALERSMGALDASVHAQRQLVADASHELRTPVTSLRTNIEILQQAHDIDAGMRAQLFNEIVEQIEELTLLVNDLIDLARGEEPPADTEDVRLDVVVQEAVERARRRVPERVLETELSPTVLPGVPARLGRAVNNLIDNALKYSPAERPVEIRLTAGELTVRDHGPGISAADLPHIFDRFYRGAEARGRPGSGLGLAIVRQVVEQHGGSILAEAAPGGGTAMRLRLPGAEPVPEEPATGELPYTGAR